MEKPTIKLIFMCKFEWKRNPLYVHGVSEGKGGENLVKTVQKVSFHISQCWKFMFCLI